MIKTIALHVILPFYLLINFLALLTGLIDNFNDLSKYKCTDPKYRIEYLFPGHALGCWLAEVPKV